MQIRPATVADLDRLIEIDATIESTQYLHLDQSGEGYAVAWKIEERPLRTKLIDSNAPDEDARFALRQVVAAIEDGIALAAEHDDELIGLAVAQFDAGAQALRLLDLRVDYDQRRQGVGSAMLFQIISHAREQKLRAVAARTLTHNLPANAFLQKVGFDLTGFDTHFASNHDLVKEAVSLFWYMPLD